MGITYDYGSSNLLCAEDNTSILEFDDSEEGGFDGEAEGHEQGWIPEQRSDFYGDFLKSFPLQSEECIALLVEKELEHMPREDYTQRLQNGDLDISVRRDAIDWIGKVGVSPFPSSFQLSLMNFLLGFELHLFSDDFCPHGV